MAVSREDIRVRVRDGVPVLDVDGTEIELRPTYTTEGFSGTFEDFDVVVERTAEGTHWFLDSKFQGLQNLTIEPRLSESDTTGERGSQ